MLCLVTALFCHLTRKNNAYNVLRQMQHWYGSRIISDIDLGASLVPDHGGDLVAVVLAGGLKHRRPHIRTAAGIPTIAHAYAPLGRSECYLLVVGRDFYVGYGALLETNMLDLDKYFALLFVCDSRSDVFKISRMSTTVDRKNPTSIWHWLNPSFMVIRGR